MIAQTYVASAWFRGSIVKETFCREEGKRYFFFGLTALRLFLGAPPPALFIALQRNQPQRSYNFYLI